MYECEVTCTVQIKHSRHKNNMKNGANERSIRILNDTLMYHKLHVVNLQDTCNTNCLKYNVEKKICEIICIFFKKRRKGLDARNKVCNQDMRLVPDMRS